MMATLTGAVEVVGVQATIRFGLWASDTYNILPKLRNCVTAVKHTFCVLFR